MGLALRFSPFLWFAELRLFYVTVRDFSGDAMRPESKGRNFMNYVSQISCRGMVGLLGLAVVSAATPSLAQSSTSGSAQDQQVGQITFQDIYNNPDDADLNLAYAKQQAASGNLIDAASTLERLLMQDKDWDSARLFYAIVLFNLDDRKASEREFELLETRDLSPDQLETVANYRESIRNDADAASANDRTSVYARVALTARYDDNAGAVIADAVIGNQGRGDESLGLTLQAGIQHALESNPDISLFASGTFQNRRHEDFSVADFDVYGVNAGARGLHDRHSWSVSGTVRSIDINNQNFLDQFGGSATYGYQASEAVRARVFGRYLDQNYKATATNVTASDRSGDFIDAGAGLDFKLSEQLEASVEAAYQSVSATAARFNYDGPRLTVRSRLYMSPKAYLDASGTYRRLNYDLAANAPAGTLAREDEFLRLRGAFGFKPADLLGGNSTTGFLSLVTMEIAANHSERMSNTSPDYENTGGELRLILDF